MTLAFEILRLVLKGIELGCHMVFGLLLLAVICGFCTAAANQGAFWIVLLLVLGAAGYCCFTWVCENFPYKRFLRTSSLGYLGLLCAVGMAGAGFLYGITLCSGHIR